MTWKSVIQINKHKRLPYEDTTNHHVLGNITSTRKECQEIPTYYEQVDHLTLKCMGESSS